MSVTGGTDGSTGPSDDARTQGSLRTQRSQTHERTPGDAGSDGGTTAALASRSRSPFLSVPQHLLWALLIPLLSTVAGWSGQYPHGLWLAAPLALGTVCAAGFIAGGRWHRPGAATLACVAACALVLFAGPALYDLYAKRVGDQLDAMVTQTGQRRNAKGTTMETCTVIDTSGAVHRISEQQNCSGQFKPGQRVILYKDPAGLLDPYIEEPDQQALDTTGLGISAALFAVTSGALLYGGQRRR
ncbi:hypothetical protein [Streptomyces zagrosensis]|uniref:Uncharacterized protein n=1 Tax=Streptomyces zagrosensis TaxID=1042984 RepID=A0A7W9QIA7_9ACTN|nr:hypothetical protein [Streptomyces zagrosensis]MBB5939732.1 hypothetical protein [Streptomyces zagrosensis]